MRYLRFKDFEAISELYWKQYFEPDWKKFGDIENSNRGAIQFFLYYYAFARQGSAQDYRYIAVDVIDELKDQFVHIDEKLGKTAWIKFHEKKISGLNEKNNPFCPKGSEYTLTIKDNKITKETQGQSIFEFIRDIDQINLILWAKDKLSKNEVEGAFKLLININGIGRKIASFYLRDIAVKFNLQISIDQRYLLQPIDVWIRNFVKEILGEKLENDVEIQKFICKKSEKEKTNPEKVNQGIWYFCTEIANSSQYLLKECYKDKEYLIKLLKEHQNSISNSNRINSDWISRKPIKALK